MITPIKEACVENLTEAITAESSGADRLELCSRLDLDGLTPNYETIQAVVKNCQIPIMLMIRPRGGDFEYTEAEFEIMKNSIKSFKNLKVKGFVFGITRDGRLDYDRIQQLTELAVPYDVCIHKAIDSVPDPILAVSKLLEIKGINRILTSGGKPTAAEGIEVLSEMIKVSENQISIMPAGKITSENIDVMHKKLGAKEYHGRRIVAS